MQLLTQLVTIQFLQEFQRLPLLVLLLVVVALEVLLEETLVDTVEQLAVAVVYSQLEKFQLHRQMFTLLSLEQVVVVLEVLLNLEPL
jgi:hypothetical protein